MRVEEPKIESFAPPAGRPNADPRESQPLTARDLIGATNPGELDLFPFLLLLRSHVRRTLACALLGLLVAAGYTYTRKPRYSSTATILIPQGNNASASSQVLQVATGLDLLGGGYQVYLDILRSRAVEDHIIQQYDLQNHYKVQGVDAAEGILTSRTTMFAAVEGMLGVTVQDEDPKLAADIANGYFAELSQLNARLGITAAGQLRRYYEGEMVKEKNALGDAEVALEQSQEKSGVLDPQAQAGASLGAEENTRALLRARQIELEGLLQSETEQNPQVVRLRAEIAGIEGQLRSLESSGGLAAGTPVAQQPAQALDKIRKQREVKFHEALMDMLTRQLENARQQESKNISMLEILDVARPSTFRDWPPRRTWLGIGLIAGLVLGILWTALESLFSVILSNPSNRARLRALARGTIAKPDVL